MATDRVIVSFKPSVDRASALSVETDGLLFQKPAGLQGAIVYSIMDNSTVAEKVEALSHNPGARVFVPGYACASGGEGGGCGGGWALGELRGWVEQEMSGCRSTAVHVAMGRLARVAAWGCQQAAGLGPFT